MYNNGHHEDPSAIMRRITAQQEEMAHLPDLPSPPRSASSSYDNINNTTTDDASGMSVVVRRKNGARRGNTPKNGKDIEYNSSIMDNNNSNVSMGNAAGRRVLSPLKPNNSNNHNSKKEVPLARKLYKGSAASPSSVSSSAKTAHRIPSFSLANNNNKANSTPTRAAHVVQSPQQQQQQQLDASTNDNSINRSLDASQMSSLNISRDLEQQLQEMDNSDLVRNDPLDHSNGAEEEEDDIATPVPRAFARFTSNTFPSPIPEEAEEQENDDQQVDASESLPDLPSFQTSSPAISSPALADAHVAVRKRITKRRTVSGPHSRDEQEQDSPSSLPSTPPASATTAATPASTVYSTPGLGRRLPSAERRSSSISANDISTRAHLPSPSSTETPKYPSSSASPATVISSKAYASSSTIDNFATPRQASSDADLERRKTHLLSTLRLTALRSVSKPNKYLKRATPYHNAQNGRRARSVTPALLINGQEESTLEERDEESEGDGCTSRQALQDEQDMTTTSTLSSTSSTSSHDLTTHPRGTGNTSLPLVGAQSISSGGLAGAGTRFNGAKLNNYLHTLNTHLTKENQNLVESLKETQNQVQRLLRQHQDASGEGEEGEDEGDVTREMLENHQRTRDDIRQMRDYLSRGLEGEDAEGSRVDQVEEEKNQQVSQLEKELAALREQMSACDDEIGSLRKQVLEQGQEGQTASDLQKQVFDLQDALTSARSSNTSLQDSLSLAEQKLLDSTSRHASIVSSLQSRTDDLLVQLEEKDMEIEGLQKEVEGMEGNFAKKMKDLEEELCKVMEEQEDAMRVLKRDNATLKNEKEENEKVVTDLRTEVEQLQSQKDKVQDLLEKASTAPVTSSSSSTSRKDELEKQNALLHDRINLLTDDIKALENDFKSREDEVHSLRASSAQASSQHSQAVQELENTLSSQASQITQLERKLSSATSSLEETESALASSEQQLRDASSQLTSLRIQLEETQANYARLQQKLANSSIAFDNELQKKLDLANREIGNLKFQLANPVPLPSSSATKNDSAREIEIRTLRSSNHELETRVNQLRRQAIANNMMLVTPIKDNGSGMTPEKSVRFDTVKSMKTPRSASMILGNLSLDKTGGTDGNLTVAPLYVEIDNLNDHIRNLRGFLEEANSDVDDKLRKLDRAGINTITLAEKLEEAHLNIRQLEGQLSGRRGGQMEGSGSEKVVKELRGVKEQLAKERGSLLKELSDIKQHCQHISAQLEASRSLQSKTLRELDFQTGETNRLRLKLNSSQSDTVLSVEDRDMIMNGVQSLQSDLERVQNEARAIGQDLRLVRSGQSGLKQPFGAMTCNKTACMEAANLHKQQAKGLLVQIAYLKACFSRESWFRADLAQQKLYLQADIRQKQKSIDMTNATLTRFGMPPTPMKSRKKHTLKSVASAVLFTTKMSRLSKEWAKQTAVRASIREAYKQTRGKPLLQ